MASVFLDNGKRKSQVLNTNIVDNFCFPNPKFDELLRLEPKVKRKYPREKRPAFLTTIILKTVGKVLVLAKTILKV